MKYMVYKVVKFILDGAITFGISIFFVAWIVFIVIGLKVFIEAFFSLFN